jgi:flagellar basal body-associated protein FliL
MQEAIQPATPKRKNRMLIVLIITAVIVLVACAAIFAFIFSQIGQVTSHEVPAMQKTVDDFIHTGGRQDVAAGYALFAPEAQQQFTQEDVQKMFAKTQLFEKFQSTAITSFSINSNAPDGSPVTTAQLDGTVTYSDRQGTFKAELMKVGDRWLLVNINLTN